MNHGRVETSERRTLSTVFSYDKGTMVELKQSVRMRMISIARMIN
jgi:hypothetical protein